MFKEYTARTRALIVFGVIGLITLEMFATDIYINCLPHMCQLFAAEPSLMKATVMAFLVGASTSGMVYGPLSDAWGRIPVVQAGLFIFLGGALGAVMVETPAWLLFYRIIQGLGGGMAWVVGLAMIKDVFPSERSTQILAMINMVVAIVPATAPALGTLLDETWGWQANFWFLTVWSLILILLMFLLIPETRLQPTSISLRHVIKRYSFIFSNPHFIYNASSAGAVYGALWLLITAFPFVTIDHLGMLPMEVALWGLLGVLCYMAGSGLGQLVHKRIGGERMLRWGLLIVIGSTALQVVGAVVAPDAFWPMRLTTGVFSFGMAFVFPNTTSRALDSSPNAVGASSGALALLEVVWAAGSVGVYKLAHPSHPLPLGIGMFILSVLAVIFYVKGQTHRQA